MAEPTGVVSKSMVPRHADDERGGEVRSLATPTPPRSIGRFSKRIAGKYDRSPRSFHQHNMPSRIIEAGH
jgi:hypothetical protein